MRDVGFRVEFASSIFVRHIADFAINRTFGPPRAIVFTHDGPGNSGISIGITAIELVTVVKAYGDLERFGWRWTPFEDLFRPVHAQVAVHSSGQHHLSSRRVPERIVGFRVLDLLFTIDLLPWITEVQSQAPVGPRFARVEAVIARIVPDKINRELTANDQLFEKCFLVDAGRIGFFHREGDRARIDMAEMQVWRKPARAFEAG